MTNEEKYKTADERFDAFKRWCQARSCERCEYYLNHCPTYQHTILMWFERECEKEAAK